MFRRDLLATLLALLPASAARSLVDAVETLVDDVEDDQRDAEPVSRTVVVDRIEGDTAVLLFEDGSHEKPVPAAALPAAAREEGVVLRVPRGNSLALATVDRAATARRRREAGDRFDDLAEQAPASEASGNSTAT